jgi:hypothetical protein
MLIDAAVLYGLNSYDKKLQAKKVENARAAEIEHEIDKKASRAQKVATREQRKVQDKLTKQKTAGQSSFAPRQTIQQPDNNKKSR